MNNNKLSDIELEEFYNELHNPIEEEEQQRREPANIRRSRKDSQASEQYSVKGKDELMKFILENIKGRSRTTIKSYLANRMISVNGLVTMKFNHPLNEGDVVRLNFGQTREPFRHSMLSIVFEDDHLLVINKNNGLLSMATDSERSKTAYYILSQYVKSIDPRNRIFIVHRLDRETSGLMLFAKSENVQHLLQQNWAELVLERKYVAVAGGRIMNDTGTISSYLAENSAFMVYSTKDPEAGELAVTHYEVLQRSPKGTLVELELETGKKNQIRVHMNDLNCPIIGDRKYGGRQSDIGRIALHARKIRFIHPITNEELTFDTGVPRKFYQLL